MRSRCQLSAIVILIATLFCATAFATITGTVTDTTGSPVSGALVTFTDELNPDNLYSDYTDDDGKYELQISPSSVDEETPSGFHIYQNYPNPFNPTTTIPYSLNEAGFVNLSIYNITGQKVRTLVDNYHLVGSHTVTWNGIDDSGKSLAAGIYIYQLKCGDTVESRKMLLIDGGSSGSFSGLNQIVTQSTVMAKSVSEAENTTYLVTITGDDIEPYEESGVNIVDGETYDFVVVRKTSEIQGIALVSIPGGTFEMGDEDGDRSWAMPVHTVTVSGFDMSTTEITNERYAAYLNEALASGDINKPSEGIVTGKTGEHSSQEYIDLSGSYSYPQNECWIGYKYNTFVVESGYEKWPVTWVTWFGAKAFAICYGLDLPREAEWEYAARGGKQYKYGTDDGTISTIKANYLETEILHPVDVGSYPANPFGLKDMSGNVLEWCNDWYDDYSSESANNPTGAPSGFHRVVRGGSWGGGNCRAAGRGGGSPYLGGHGVGFRVVRRKPAPPKITFVPIPGGTFQMGDIQEKGYSNEKPVHDVTLSSFEMSTYEITNAQYATYFNAAKALNDITVNVANYEITGATGQYSGEYYFYYGYDYSEIHYTNNTFTVEAGKDNYPVYHVSWYGAKAFAFYYNFDLPTEAEWEYACRAGTETLFYTGNSMSSDGERSGDLDRAGWYYYNSDTDGDMPLTHEVGQMEKNAFGLYDLHGNVWEWCNDWYGDYPSGIMTNPTGPDTGSNRVIRGGSWDNGAGGCRSAIRGRNDPFLYYNIFGFRVVRRP